MVVDPNIAKDYKKYLDRADSFWDFGNSILYKMCKDYPNHNKKDVIMGKIWLIGRSYAAAIERVNNPELYNGDDFYRDEVAPKMLAIGKELDRRLNRLKKSSGIIVDDVKDILTTHKFLMKAFYDITGLEKRSLASKYLHFHYPDKFFIYDSRAKKAIQTIVKRPDKSILSDLKEEEYDEEYGDFVCRMLELQEYLDVKLGKYELPRRLDSYLLIVANRLRKKEKKKD